MIHRDDIPFERVEEIERQVKQITGDENTRLIFPGDMPKKDMPQDVLDRIEEIERINEESINRGFCVDCFQAMPIYAPWEEKWKPDEGWTCLMGVDEEPAGWLCEMCVNEMSMDGEMEFDDDDDERWTVTDKDPDELEGDFE